MPTIALSLRYNSNAVRPVAAWYLPGAQPAAWLDEISHWSVDQSGVRLLPIPCSSSDRTPSGVLVPLEPGRLHQPSQTCVPFGRIGRLYLPVHATIAPETAERELDDLLSERMTYVWHPAVGLIGFEAGEEIPLWQLLHGGGANPSRWDRARTAVAPAPRLVAIEPEEMLNIDSFLDDGREDIGDHSDALDELKPSPDEPKANLWNRAGRRGTEWIASVTRRLVEYIPATSSQPTWVDRVGAWANQQLARVARDLDAIRHKELLRLLRLLEDDPDRGLQYALPVGEDAGHRGVAPPSDRLARHDTDFSFHHLRGGRPTDFWYVPPDYRYQLISRYRDLANRELQLGRHRRAAYIFASLLSDFDAAAAALADGRHWREAAELYHRRLHRPLDAASCLVQGGLWIEAIALYEQVGAFESAGDIYQRLGQLDDARDQYRRAVEQHRTADDHLAAAKLLEEKLKSIDEAIAELESAWPESQQALTCLDELFQLWGRAGRHGDAAQAIDSFRHGQLPRKNRIGLIEVLGATAARYPDSALRESSADCARVLIARQLAAASHAETRRMMGVLRGLAKEDRLLSRDCQRFLETTPITKPKPSSGSRSNRTAHLVRTLELTTQSVNWQTAAWSHGAIFVAGRRGAEIVFARFGRDAVDRSTVSWKIDPSLSLAPIVLSTGRVNDGYILVHVIGSWPLARAGHFPAGDAIPFATGVRSLQSASPRLIAVSGEIDGPCWFVTEDGTGLTVSGYDQVSGLLASWAFPALAASVPRGPYPLPFHASRGRFYVGIRGQLSVMENKRIQEQIDLDQLIVSVVGSPPNTRRRLVVAMEKGASLLWDERGGLRMQSFSHELNSPRVCFCRGGHLVAADDERYEVHRTVGHRIVSIAESAHGMKDVIAVVPTPQTKGFSLIASSGQIQMYELDR